MSKIAPTCDAVIPTPFNHKGQKAKDRDKRKLQRLLAPRKNVPNAIFVFCLDNTCGYMRSHSCFVPIGRKTGKNNAHCSHKRGYACEAS